MSTDATISKAGAYNRRQDDECGAPNLQREILRMSGKVDELKLTVGFVQDRVTQAERSDRDLYECVGKITTEVAALTKIAKQTQDEVFRVGTKFDAYLQANERVERAQEGRLDTLTAWHGASVADQTREDLIKRAERAEKELFSMVRDTKKESAWWRQKAVKVLFYVLAIVASVATGAGIMDLIK